MTLIKIPGKEKKLGYITIIIIGLLLIYNLLLKPVFEKWQQLGAEIAQKETELNSALKYLSQEQSIMSTYQKLAARIRKAGTDEEETASFLSVVQSKASVSGVRIYDIRPRPFRDLDFCQKFLLEMDCEAALPAYVDFIYNLQKADQLIRVERLHLAAQGQNNPLLKARLTVSKILTEQ